MVVAEGPSAIFKISMALLRDHKVELMKLDGFEQVADYIKNQMNTIDVDKMKDVLHVAGEIDLGKGFCPMLKCKILTPFFRNTVRDVRHRVHCIIRT